MEIVRQYYDALNKVGILNYRNMEETGEMFFLQRYLSKLTDPVVFDVGANVGAYAKTVLGLSASARVFAFEPHPTTFGKLSAAVADPRLRPINVGVGAADETASFYDYQDEDGSEHASLYKEVIEQVHHRPSVCHQVSVRRLDGLATELGVSRIHLLKVDTEGHEMSVFQGGEGLIRSGAVDVIQFEFNETNVVSRTFFKDFWDFLPDYDFYRLLPNGALRIGQYNATFCEVFAFQNIVCAKKGMNVFG